MKKEWSKDWKSSKQPRKQRKYLHKSPLHIRRRFFSANLSKELRKKYGIRNIPLRKGDTVKIMKGQFKKKTGKINRVMTKKTIVYIEGIENVKKDGAKILSPIHPSNIQIIELNLEDKRRIKK